MKEGNLLRALEKSLHSSKLAPYDISVRWKPLHEQPIGWEPDINDGALEHSPLVDIHSCGGHETQEGCLRTAGYPKDQVRQRPRQGTPSTQGGFSLVLELGRENRRFPRRGQIRRRALERPALPPCLQASGTGEKE